MANGAFRPYLTGPRILKRKAGSSVLKLGQPDTVAEFQAACKARVERAKAIRKRTGEKWQEMKSTLAK